MKKRTLSLLLTLIMLLSLVPVFASADETVSKVSIRTYPDSSYGYDNNQVPLVGEDASDIYALISSGEATMNDYYLSDGGSRATGLVEFKNYEFVAVVSANAGYVFDAGTSASVNNSYADIYVSDDGSTATISQTLTPRAMGPQIYHNPTSETHPAGSTFSFAASASNYETSQWYIQTPYNIRYTPQEAYDKVGLYCAVSDDGTYTKCNISGVTENFNGWMVYCEFTGIAGFASTTKAFINVEGGSDPYVTPAPSPTATNNIWIVETPEPSIWIVETPTPEIIETLEPTVEPTPEVKEKTSDHKGLKIALGVVGGVALLGGGLVGTQYLIDNNKRKKRAKNSKNTNSSYKGRH